jgi:cytochrome c biogenesis protein CcdA
MEEGKEMNIEKRNAMVLGIIAFLPMLIIPTMLLIMVYENTNYPYLAQMMFTYVIGVTVTLYLYRWVFGKFKNKKITFNQTIGWMIIAQLPIAISLLIILIAFPFN